MADTAKPEESSDDGTRFLEFCVQYKHPWTREVRDGTLAIYDAVIDYVMEEKEEAVEIEMKVTNWHSMAIFDSETGLTVLEASYPKDLRSSVERIVPEFD